LGIPAALRFGNQRHWQPESHLLPILKLGRSPQSLDFNLADILANPKPKCFGAFVGRSQLEELQFVSRHGFRAISLLNYNYLLKYFMPILICCISLGKLALCKLGT